MQNNLSGIINTPVILSDIDAFWELGPEQHLSPRDTLVFASPFEPESPEAQLIHKMLAACKLEANDYHILQLDASKRLAWHLLKAQVKASKVLLFGVLPGQLGVSAMMLPHQINHFDGAQWMPSFSLNQVEGNTELKQHLWANALKPMYLG